MNKAIIKAIAVIAAAVCVSGEAYGVTKTVKISPKAANALVTLFPQTASKSQDSSSGSLAISRKTGTVAVRTSGQKRTVTRKVSSSLKLDKATKANEREGTITIDLQTGEVSYTYAMDWGITLTLIPPPFGACSPSVGAGFRIETTGAANPLSFSSSQGPYVEGGITCGAGCLASVSGNINLSGGARERIPAGSRYAVGELYGAVSANVTVNVACVTKFQLVSWTLAERSQELARVSF